MLEVLVTGVSGRMGQAVLAAVEQNPAASVGATHDAGMDLAEAIEGCRVIIDFSFHGFTRELLAEAVSRNIPVVIGTTGHTDEEREVIVSASEKIPVVFASNYSVGVNTLFWLTRKAAGLLTDGFDIEVVEMHHRHKIDSPSGTARTLVEILCEESGMSMQGDVVYGREGNVGPRPAKQIGVHALRGGDVVGDHTVVFAADGERVELAHKASSRMTFANGAVRAALWLKDQPAGLYNMEDVLGFNNL